MAINTFNAQLLGLYDLLAEADAFQTWVAAADATTAKDNIHLYRQDLPTQDNFAILAKDDQWTWQRRLSGRGFVAGDPSSKARLEFWRKVPEYTEAAIVEFLDDVAGILAGMLDIHGGAGTASEVIDNLQEIPHAMRDAGQRPTYRFPIGSERGYMIAFLVGRKNR